MRVFWVALLLASPPASAGPRQHYLTELGRRILARCDQLVTARVQSIHPAFRGITTARLEVIERHLGYDRKKVLTLMYVEEHLAPDVLSATLERQTVRYERTRKAGLEKYLADLSRLRVPRPGEQATGKNTVNRSRESARGGGRTRSAGVQLARGEEGIFFLALRGATYSLIGYVSQADALYRSKQQRLRDVMRIEAIPAITRRLQEAKRFFMAGLESRDVWVRGNSAREVMSLAVRFPKLFSEEEGRRLSKRLFSEREAPIQAALERAVRAVDPDRALAYAQRAEAAERNRHAAAVEEERKRVVAVRAPELRAADVARLGRRFRRAATGALSVFLEDEDAIVRESAAQTLAEQGGPSCRAALRDALAKERDGHAALAMVYACGVKSDAGSAALVGKRLSEPFLERTAIHALARIGTPEARRLLVGHRASAATETKRLIDRLLEEEFAGRS